MFVLMYQIFTLDSSIRHSNDSQQLHRTSKHVFKTFKSCILLTCSISLITKAMMACKRESFVDTFRGPEPAMEFVKDID